MRHAYRRFLTTVSVATLCIVANAAGAVTDVTTSDSQLAGTVLRGGLDIAAKDSTLDSKGREKRKRLSLSQPAPPPMVMATTVTTGNASARNIALNYFKWDGEANGNGVIVAVVDGGIDLDHSEFSGRVLTGTCFGRSTTICSVEGGSIGGDPGIYGSQNTHGTHVAGIIAGATTGLATTARILPVKVCDTNSSSCPGDPDSGIVWASQNGAKVINLSLGGSSLYASDIHAASVAIANGSLIVVSAGNSGNATPAGGYLAGAAIKDGVRGGMIVVGALNSSNTIASFSQTPGATCEVSGGTNYCMRDYFVVAPGSGITSAVGGGGYGVKSGTSMAAPYVSGVAALIKGEWSYLKPEQIANIIFQTTDDLGAPGTDDVYGRGAVNITRAMSPVGGSEIIVATAGKKVTNATGARGVLNTSSLGPMSAPLQSSSLLKNVVVVDTFGRNYNADLTKLAQTRSLAIGGPQNDLFHRLSPFSIASDVDNLGTVSVSGFVQLTTNPEEDESRGGRGYSLATAQNVAVSISPSSNLSFDVGHNLYLSGYVNDYDVRAGGNDGGVFLSASALNSPYLALADGANFVGTTYALFDNVKLRVGYADTGNSDRAILPGIVSDSNQALIESASRDTSRREARSVIAGAFYEFADWGGIGLTATNTVERNGILSGYSSGAFGVADTSRTAGLGVSARLKLGEGWATSFAWNEGVTRLDLVSGGLFSSAGALRSRAYGIAFTKDDILGGDMLGLAVTRPLHIYAGGATIEAATGLGYDEDLVYGREYLSLAAVRPETDFEFGYTMKLLGGRMTLQGNAAYQMDVDGQAGTDAIAAIARAGFRF
jgi:subtilisin family serine protease